MAKLILGQLRMFHQETCADTSSATSLPVSEAGATHSGLPDGQTIDTSGQEAAPASHSAKPRQLMAERASTTSGTYGQPGGSLSRSAVLQRCLESNLRRLLTGSDSYEVIWKRWDTPWGQCLSRPRALARITNGTDFGLWPTLTATGNLLSPSMQKRKRHRSLLPTLTAHDYRGGAKPERTARMRETSRRGTDLVTTLRAIYGGTGRIDPVWAAAFMGYPIEWAQCAALVMPSSRKSLQSLSKPISRPEHEP